MRELIIWSGFLLLSMMVFNCGGKQQTLTSDDIQKILTDVKNLPTETVSEDEVAVIETDFGKIIFEFFPQSAPEHCGNFKKLANYGFFDGTTFHRIVPGFVIQGGDILSRDANPANDGVGTDTYTLPAEIKESHHRGSVAAARKGDQVNPEKRSSMSQFYICVGEPSFLDGNYTVFGQVIKGMDVVDEIVKQERDKRDRPVKNIYMNRVYVTTREKAGI